MREKIILLATVFLALTGLAGCRSGGLEPELTPPHEQFLSQVRYIITSQEKRDFLRMADSDRPQFIEEFWKRRDPDPDTPENETRDDYLNRLSEANRLFIGEGREGWLTERGRFYILYGPPTERQFGAVAADESGRCREIWYYGDFPVVFADPQCRGAFSLATMNLSRIERLNLNRAAVRRTSQLPGTFVSFEVHLKKKLLEETRFEGLVEIDVPYASIWFGAEGGMLKTNLELKLELKDSQNAVRWQHQSKHEVALAPQDLAEKKSQKYLIEVPFLVDKEVAALRLGKNKLEITLVNTTGKEQVRKIVEFSLEQQPCQSRYPLSPLISLRGEGEINIDKNKY
jgi:GWxTD domain-containing protein